MEKNRLFLDRNPMLSAQQVDVALRANYEKALAAANPAQLIVVIGSYVDYFGDGVHIKCADCGADLVLRPWLAELIKNRLNRVMCVVCGVGYNQDMVKGAVVKGFALIDKAAEVF